MDEMIEQCTQMMGQMNSMMGSGMMGGMMGMPAGMMGGGGMGGAGWWPSPWYWLGWVLVLSILAFLIIGLVWALRGLRQPVPTTVSPLAILRRRYAQGELSPEQFETMNRQLSGD